MMVGIFVAVIASALPGGPRRWSTEPWLCVFHALICAAGGLWIASKLLAPWILGHEASLGLRSVMTVAVSLAIAGPPLDEALASLQFTRRIWRWR